MHNAKQNYIGLKTANASRINKLLIVLLILSFKTSFAKSTQLQGHPLQQALYIKKWYNDIILQNIALEFGFFADNLARKLGIPGMAITLVTPDKVLLKKTYGIKKKDFYFDPPSRNSKQENLNKIDSNTVFRLGSVSKTLTSFLIYKLCNKEIQGSKNRFCINCNIVDFLPKDLYISNVDFTKKLKIKHILTHSCGVYKYCLEEVAYKDRSLELLLEELKYISKPYHKPGIYFAYQNVIFSLIKPILESCFREKYEHIFKLHVLDNLKLSNTIVCEEEYSSIKNKALPHIMHSKSYKNISVDSYYDNILPAGGIASSIEDMAKFIIHVLKDPMYINFIESYVVNANSKKKMEKHNYDKEAYDKIRSWQYGIGWYIENYDGSKIIFHGGRLTGFRAMIQFLPKYKVGLVILTNSSNGIFCNILRHYLVYLYQERFKL